jgi:ribonuclease HI
MTNWINKWMDNAWLKSDGTPLKHKHYYQELLYLTKDINVQWVRIFVILKVSQLVD